MRMNSYPRLQSRRILAGFLAGLSLPLALASCGEGQSPDPIPSEIVIPSPSTRSDQVRLLTQDVIAKTFDRVRTTGTQWNIRTSHERPGQKKDTEYLIYSVSSRNQVNDEAGIDLRIPKAALEARGASDTEAQATDVDAVYLRTFSRVDNPNAFNASYILTAQLDGDTWTAGIQQECPGEEDIRFTYLGRDPSGRLAISETGFDVLSTQISAVTDRTLQGELGIAEEYCQ